MDGKGRISKIKIKGKVKPKPAGPLDLCGTRLATILLVFSNASRRTQLNIK